MNNPIYKLFCRAYQGVFRIALPILPYRVPKLYYNTKDGAKILNNLNLKRALLVTDSFLRESKITSDLEKALKSNGIDCFVYDSTKANPTVRNVEEALEIYLKNKCQCIIGFGGGSPMDCAKAVGARVAYPDKPIGRLKGILKVLRKTPPFIAVPTTAGSGSETTLTAVITDAENKHKYTINSFPLIPDYAILDPKVTYSLPKHITATTGMDALTHAVEAFIGRSTTKDTRAMCLEATKLIFENIYTAYCDGTNNAARSNMLKAAHLAGNAFSQSYVGYVHAVAHTLGGQYNIPHGLANSVLLPIVLEDYGEIVYKKLSKLSVATGVADVNDTEKEAATKFISAIKNLNGKMGIPDTLSGINKDDIERMSKIAAKEANPLYPVPVIKSAKELEKYYYAVADWSNSHVG